MAKINPKVRKITLKPQIDSDVADGKHSVILQQVSHGIAIRMAIMAMTMGQVNINENKGKHE